jgi:hypothetical protein
VQRQPIVKRAHSDNELERLDLSICVSGMHRIALLKRDLVAFLAAARNAVGESRRETRKLLCFADKESYLQMSRRATT